MEKLLLPPTAEHLAFLSQLILMMLLFHMPFIGMVLGTSILSLVNRFRDEECARDVINLVAGSVSSWVIFGITPFLGLTVLFYQYLYNSHLPFTTYMARLFPLVFGGYVLVYAYQRTLRPLLGLIGTGSILLSYFFFCSVMTLVYYPEMWPLTKTALPHLFSISVLIYYLVFVFSSLLITGAGILFFYYRWPERKLAESVPYYTVLKQQALVLIILPSMVLPVLTIWDLATLPDFTMSPMIYGLVLFSILTLCILAVMAVFMLSGSHHRFATTAFVFALVFFCLILTKNHAMQNNANYESLAVLNSQAMTQKAAILAERQQLYAKNMEVDPKLGEKIYTERCSACHAFDKVVLGPAYASVLPKYKDDTEALKKFIRNPVKIDPNYPPMPNQA